MPHNTLDLPNAIKGYKEHILLEIGKLRKHIHLLCSFLLVSNIYSKRVCFIVCLSSAVMMLVKSF